MRVVEFDLHKFKKMEKLLLDNRITSTECQMYFLPVKEKWENKVKLFKNFYIDSGEYFSNKLFTIHELVDSREELQVENVVFPDELVAIDGKVCGYMMPYIESENLSLVLQDSAVESNFKINLLKQVGDILKKVATTDKYVKPFLLGDVNENNFVVDDTGTVYAVDLDSCKIGNNLPFPSRYIHVIGKKSDTLAGKYIKNEEGIYIPTQNTELSCFNIMVMNTIANGRVDRLCINEFYYYLEYLKTLDYDFEIIDCFASIYSSADTKDPSEILEFIPEMTGQATLKVYKYLRDKNR